MKNIRSYKAAILVAQKKKLKILKISNLQDLSPGQVEVKIISAAICGAQIGEIDGIKGPDKWLPHCLGHEGYGKVINKHSGIKNFKIGDEVILHWRKSSGINAKSAKYNSKIGIINAGQVTTLQKYAIVSENRLSKIKKFKNYYKIAPMLGCALPTSWGILNKETKFNNKNKYLIIGAGGIGLTVAALAKIQNAKDILLVEKFRKNKILENLDLKSINLKSFFKLKDKYFNITIDTTGNANNISKAFDLTSKNGVLVLVGQPKKNTILKLNDPIRLFNAPNDNIKIISSDGGQFNPKKDLIKLVRIVKKNYTYLKKLITDEIKLDNINEYISKIKSGKSARVIIKL
jgi:Zn-dependent alcohol dehydrogenase